MTNNQEINYHPRVKELVSGLKAQGIDPLSIYDFSSTTKLSKRNQAIPGVRPEYVNLMVETIIIWYAEHHTYPSSRELKRLVSPPVPEHLPFRMMENEIFLSILVARGLPSPDAIYKDADGVVQQVKLTEGLSSRQMLALTQLTDVTNKTPLSIRLKRLGISPQEFNNWMRNSNFRSKYDAISKELFIKAQSSIDVQLASGALEGRLEFIKYYNEVSGRHDPNKKSKQDIEFLMREVVEIITRNVTDSATLNRISAELGALLVKLEV